MSEALGPHSPFRRIQGVAIPKGRDDLTINKVFDQPQPLSFERRPSALEVEGQKCSTWNIFGRASRSPKPACNLLTEILHATKWEMYLICQRNYNYKWEKTLRRPTNQRGLMAAALTVRLHLDETAPILRAFVGREMFHVEHLLKGGQTVAASKRVSRSSDSSRQNYVLQHVYCALCPSHEPVRDPTLCCPGSQRNINFCFASTPNAWAPTTPI